jgi:hypothetical protein
MACLGPPPLFEGDDSAAYNDLLARVSAAIKPTDIFEEIWLRDFLDLAWEALRCRRLRAALVNGAVSEGLANVLRPLMAVRAFASEEVASEEAGTDQDAERPSCHELAVRWAAREPQAVAEVDALLASANLSIERALASAFGYRMSDVERIDRMIISAEARRNAVLHEIERHRSTLGQELRRVLRDAQHAQDAEFEVVDVTPAAAGSVM